MFFLIIQTYCSLQLTLNALTRLVTKLIKIKLVWFRIYQKQTCEAYSITKHTMNNFKIYHWTNTLNQLLLTSSE